MHSTHSGTARIPKAQQFSLLALLLGLVGAAPACMAIMPMAETTAFVERDLQVGVQQIMEVTPGLQRLAVADDSVVGVHLQKSNSTSSAANLILTPLKAGTTSLMVWPKGGGKPQQYLLKVRPFVRQAQLHHNNLETHAQQMALLQAGQAGGTGPSSTPAGGAGGAHPGSVVQSTSNAVVDNGSVRLKSQVVQVDVKIVEVNKNRLQQAGLNIFSTRANSHGFRFGVMSAGNTGAPTFGGSGTTSLAPNATSPFSQAFGLLFDFAKAGVGINLGMLEGSGMAKVLAEPSLTAISGQSANFLAGGEIPYPMSQGNGSVSIEYKTYGVGLTVSPTVIADNRIVLKVAPESSELDYANAVQLQGSSVPAITTRRADTTVELGDGESFVIGGLVSQSIVSTVNRVPLLSQIPILGTLFKRQEFARKDRELVIVVTPRLVKPFAAGVSLEGQLPGAVADEQPLRNFWGRYLGASGSSEALPGFSQ